MQPRIAYVTQAVTEPPDPDRDVLLAALRRARLQGVPVAWDADVDWSDFDLVLIRSSEQAARSGRQEFLRRIRHIEGQTLLANPAVVLARNSDLTYLRDLAGRGVKTADTVWFEPGDSTDDCAETLRGKGWSRFAVRANTGHVRATVAHSPEEAARVAGEFASRGAVGSIQSDGEEQLVSVVLLDGHVSHAVARTEGMSGEPERVAIEAGLTEFVESMVPLAASEPLLYARVDAVEDAGQWLLKRFDAVGPTLFLDDRTAETLAWGVRRWLTEEVGPVPAG